MISYAIAVRPTTAPSDTRHDVHWIQRRWQGVTADRSLPQGQNQAEVMSQRTSTGRGEAHEVLGGKASVTGHQGEPIPMGTGDEGRIQLGPQLDSIPETDMALESGTPPPSEEGSMPVPPVTPVQPGAPDNLLEALRGASIVDEHRVLMGTVIERVQSTKSGLTEACNSLLTGFEVSSAKRR